MEKRLAEKVSNVVGDAVFDDDDDAPEVSGGGGIMSGIKNQVKNTFKDKVKEKTHELASKLQGKKSFTIMSIFRLNHKEEELSLMLHL
jgi:hypothetical protein